MACLGAIFFSRRQRNGSNFIALRARKIKMRVFHVLPLSFIIYLEIVLSIKSTNQKHGGFDVTVSLFSWGHPLTTAHA